MSGFAEGHKLFIGGLPADITREDLYAVFPTYGEVTGVHLMPADKSKTGQACAFVTYKTREAAEDAIAVLDGKYRIRAGDHVEPIKVAWPRDKNFGGGKGKGPDLPYPGPPPGPPPGGFDGVCQQPSYGKAGAGYPSPPSTNGDYQNVAFQQAGFQQAAAFPAAGFAQQAPGGCAGGCAGGCMGGCAGGCAGALPGGCGGDFAVAGGCAGGCQPAFGQTPPPNYQDSSYQAAPVATPGKGAPAAYDQAFNGGGFGAPKGGAQVSHGEGKLFIGNLPSDITEEALKYVFQNYGKVEKVHIMTGRSKSGQSCAFVEYSTLQEAETAILTLHEKYEIRPGDGAIVVKRANSAGRAKPY